MYNSYHLHVYVCMFFQKFSHCQRFRSHNKNTQDALLELGSSMILVDISQRLDAAICALTADFVGTSLVLGLFRNLRMSKMEVCSAASGLMLAVVDEDAVKDKTAKSVKQALGSKLGVSRFRQKFFVEDFSREIEDEEVFNAVPTRIQLVKLDFLSDIQQEKELLLASKKGDSETVERLLQKLQNPNCADEGGKMPLHHAARGGHSEAIRLLLDAGAEKDGQDESADGMTPLLLSSSLGRVEAVRILLESDIDQNRSTTIDGKTPLFMAVQRGHLEVVRLLIASRADTSKADRDGRIPIDVACSTLESLLE